MKLTDEEVKLLIRKVINSSEKQIEYFNKTEKKDKNSYNMYRETLLRIYKLKNFQQIKEDIEKQHKAIIEEIIK